MNEQKVFCPLDKNGVALNRWYVLAFVVCVFDQLTKHWATISLQFAIPEPVFAGFNFFLIHNSGAAFSFLHDQSGWQRWFLAAVAGILSLLIVFWIHRLGQGERSTAFGLALVLGGAVGNLLDRLYFGYVVDFIQLYYGQWSWPAFNLADSAICVGAAVLIWTSVKSSRDQKSVK